MIDPAENYTCLVSGVVLLSASTFVIYRVSKGSKSTFAYVLMAFTFMDGMQSIAFVVINLCSHPITINGKTNYF